MWQQLEPYRAQNPVATSLLESIIGQAADVNEAHAIIAEMVKKTNAKDRKGEYAITHNGKKINPSWLKARLRELYG